jgi:hypothetical protein
MASEAPGRGCPLSYRYEASSLSGAAALQADTLWVAGGLYGNPFALETLLALYEDEPGAKALVFNGDFHWFDVQPASFFQVQSSIENFLATRGNVETELAAPEDAGGCGCGYPDWVDDETVRRSNAIIARLKAAAAAFPQALQRLAALPMHLGAEVGGERVAIVHGDADSLAGWGFSQEALATHAGWKAARQAFASAGARVFASSHTCLPVLQGFPGGRALVNNGAAGMPNFAGTRFGVATRISVRPAQNPLYSMRAGALYVEAIALPYDQAAWQQRFLELWPAGSAAHRSYFERIANGPRYAMAQALRLEAALAA